MADFVFDTENPVDTLDSVPTNFQHLYTQTDDGFVVSDDHKSVAQTINALGANLANSRKTKKQASDESANRRIELNALSEALRGSGFEAEELNGETVAEFLTGLSTKAQGNSEDVAEQLRNQRKEMEAANVTALQKERGVSKVYRTAIDDLLIDSQATQAIAANKGVPALLLPAVKESTKVIEQDGRFSSVVVDETGETRFNGKGDPMTIAERVEELKSDPIYGRAFESDLPGGGGKQPENSNRKPVGPSARKAIDGDKTPSSKIASGLAGLSRR